jgi:preprotein translocase subunit SecG
VFSADSGGIKGVNNLKEKNIMYTFITILIVIAAVLLTLLVLVQNSKGGGLANGFAGGNQVMGAPKTADFLEKTTWTLIIIIVVLSIAAVGFNIGQNDATEKSAIEVEEVAAPVEVPVEAPVEVPAETPAE